MGGERRRKDGTQHTNGQFSRVSRLPFETGTAVRDGAAAISNHTHSHTHTHFADRAFLHLRRDVVVSHIRLHTYLSPLKTVYSNQWD